MKDKLMEKIHNLFKEFAIVNCNAKQENKLYEVEKALLALISQERERLLKEVKECLGSDVTPVGNDFSKEGEAYTRGYNDRLSDIRKAIKQCIK